MKKIANKRVYLAGPDVFEQDAIERGKTYVQYAKDRQLIGLYPLDNVIDPTKKEIDYEIYRLNRELIDSADYVVANLNDFRGYEPDSGTVWEVAYALAKGKCVIGYMNENTSILDRIKRNQEVVKKDSYYFDNNGKMIEDFGKPLNLMLQHSLTALVFGTIETALDEVKKITVL